MLYIGCMTEQEYKDDFENEAERLANHYSQLSEIELLELVNNNKIDRTYQIWFSIRNVVDKFKFISAIIDYLRNDSNDFLNRHHSTNTLFLLVDNNDDVLKNKIIGSTNTYAMTETQIIALGEFENLVQKHYEI